MSRMKDWAMELSEEMGFGGQITEEVIAEGERRLHQQLRLDCLEAFETIGSDEYEEAKRKAMDALKAHHGWLVAYLVAPYPQESYGDRGKTEPPTALHPSQGTGETGSCQEVKGKEG